jgi:hypothetical protein
VIKGTAGATKQVQTINQKSPQLRFLADTGGDDTVFLSRSGTFALGFQACEANGNFEVGCWKLCRDNNANEFAIGKKERITMYVGQMGPGTITFHHLLQTSWELESAIGFRVNDGFVPCILTLSELNPAGRVPRKGHFIALRDWNCHSGLSI